MGRKERRMKEFIIKEFETFPYKGAVHELPELIRCKDCKHWYDEACFVDSHSSEEADRIILDRFEDDYCSRAEKKNDKRRFDS